MLFEKIQAFDTRVQQQKIPIILCGDLNSAPDSSMFSFMRGDEIKPYHKVKEKHVYLYEKIGAQAKQQTLTLVGNLVSCYSLFPHIMQDGSIKQDFPEFTVYAKDVQKVIDHIFVTKKDFDIVSLLELPTRQDVEDFLPNRHFPSDHLRIEAVLQLRD